MLWELSVVLAPQLVYALLSVAALGAIVWCVASSSAAATEIGKVSNGLKDTTITCAKCGIGRTASAANWVPPSPPVRKSALANSFKLRAFPAPFVSIKTTIICGYAEELSNARSAIWGSRNLSRWKVKRKPKSFGGEGAIIWLARLIWEAAFA